jgi:uncharacterized small protein (DUF1192 family)
MNDPRIDALAEVRQGIIDSHALICSCREPTCPRVAALVDRVGELLAALPPDWCGHPEPALGPYYRKEIARLRAELDAVKMARDAYATAGRKIEEAARASHPVGEVACDDTRLHDALRAAASRSTNSAPPSPERRRSPMDREPTTKAGKRLDDLLRPWWPGTATMPEQMPGLIAAIEAEVAAAYVDQIAAYKAEIARLRAALKEARLGLMADQDPDWIIGIIDVALGEKP